MTWLPVHDGGSERDAVLGLKPEPYDAVRAVLTAAWSATDPGVLELCRRRLAELSSARAELVGLDGWEASREFTPRERAALDFAEQYHYDHRLVAGHLTDGLSEHLTRRQLVNFVWALQMNDAYIRIMSLLDIAPDPAGAPARSERSVPAGPWTPRAADHEADERASVTTLMEPELEAAYRVLNPVVVRQSLVDDVTSEAIRLRNASHQACHY